MIKFDAKDIAEYLGIAESTLRNLLARHAIGMTQEHRRAVLNLIVARMQGKNSDIVTFKLRHVRKRKPGAHQFTSRGRGDPG